jgi:predicted phage-related endonuclease
VSALVTSPVRRIGGSRAAAALGQSKWGTPLDVFLECTGQAELRRGDEDLTADQERGIRLEPALLGWASAKLGLNFVKPASSIESKDLAFAAVSPDGLDDGQAYLELKAPRTHEGWGAEMTDEVPFEYLVQGAHGLMVTGRRVCYFGALLGGTLKIFKHERDLDLERLIVEGERRFWEKHVLAGVAPDPQYGDEENVLRRHPKNTKPHVLFADLGTAEQRTVEQWCTFNRDRIEAENSEKAFKASVMGIIADRSGIAFGPAHPNWKRIDFQQSKAGPNGRTWHAVAEELLARLPPDEAAALVAKHTPTEGNRSLRLYSQPKKEAKP